MAAAAVPAAAAAVPPAPPAPPAYVPAPPPAAAPPQQTWVAPTAAPAAVGWVAPPAASAPQGRVTVLARFAGLLLLLIGVFWGVIGALAIAGGQAAKDALNNAGLAGGDAAATVLAGVGIVLLFFAFWEVLGGIGVIAGKGWGRVIGILYSLLFGLATLLPLSGATRAASDTTTDLGPVLVFFGGHVIAYIFIFIVLALRWRGKAPAAA